MQRLITTKICSGCKVEKDLNQFGVHKSRPDGLNYRCKKCVCESAERRRRTLGMNIQRRKVAPEGTKWCSDCKGYQSINDFHQNRRNSDNLSHICKTCASIRDKGRDHYQKTYGISRTEYDALVEDQRGLCASCGDPLVRPHLDHCHDTGRVRGVLCHHCNVALGMLKDDPKRVQLLLEYIGGEDNPEIGV